MKTKRNKLEGMMPCVVNIDVICWYALHETILTEIGTAREKI